MPLGLASMVPQSRGANPDLAYFKKVTVPRPDADHRFRVESVSAPVPFVPAVDPASGLPVGEFKATHTLYPLTVEDLKRQIETQFQLELRKQFPALEDPALLIAGADASIRKSNGSALTPEQDETLTRIQGLGDAVTQLRARQAELNAAAEAFTADPEDPAGIYDITEGWTLI